MSFFRLIVCIIVLGGLPFFVTGCSSFDNVETEAKFPDRSSGDDDLLYSGERASVFGKGGFAGLFGGGKDKEGDGSGGVGIAVNSFLWRASLDTISFMPIATADPFGGTILTDWYQPDNAASERIKVNIFILSKDLRADGLRANVFRQVKSPAATTWQDAAVDQATVRQLEDTVLTRARQLRIQQTGN